MFVSSSRATLIGLMTAALALCQQGQTTTSAPPPPPAAPSKPASPSPPKQVQPHEDPSIPIYVTGNVVLADGTIPSERVVIERLCASNQVRFEGYTDSKGNFGIQLGVGQQLIPDVSNLMFVEESHGFTDPTRVTNENLSNIYFDCELRARLSGYTSSTLMLAGRKPLDPAPIGTITLYPTAGRADGRPVSATSASAPKDARKALEKGLDEAKKGRYDKAEAEFRKAVDLHPRYAEAWTELGKVYRSLKRPADARAALAKAIVADASFAPPHEQLYQMAFEQGQWKELAEATQRLLSLNPYSFPDAYYFNGVAHYQLKNWDSAETTLAQAIKADRFNANPKTHYVMGLVLVQKKDYVEAMKHLQIFLQLAPKDPQAAKALVLVAEMKTLKP